MSYKASSKRSTDPFAVGNRCPFIKFQPCRTDCALNMGCCALVVSALASQGQVGAGDGWCVECRTRPIYTASKRAAELELCEPCYRKLQIRENEEKQMVGNLRKRERQSAAEAARRG